MFMAYIGTIMGILGCCILGLCWRRERRRRHRVDADAAIRTNDLQAVLNNLGSGLLMVDKRGLIRTVSRSACSIVGRKRSQLEDQSLNEALPEGWHEFTRCVVQVLTREESIEREEVRIVDASGESIPRGHDPSTPSTAPRANPAARWPSSRT